MPTRAAQNNSKIIIDATNVGIMPTGAGRFTLRSLAYIATTPLASHIMLLVQKNLPPDHELRQLPFKMKDVSFGVLGPKRDFLLSFELWKYRHTSRLFVSFMPYMPFYMPLRAIATVHDIGHLRYPYFRSSFHAWYFNRVYARSMKMVTAVATVSQATAQALAEQFPSISLTTVVVGNASAIEPTQTALDKTIASPYILFVGERRPHKNLRGLLQAFALMQKENQLRLVLAGKSYATYDKQLADEIKRLKLVDQVDMLSSVSESTLLSLYKQASAVVLVSEYEGFGMPIIEAMQMGVPVVTGNHSAMKEVAGEAAYLVDVYDINDMAKGLSAVVYDDDLRRQLIANGRRRAKDFSFEHVGQAFIKLIESYV